MCVYYAHLAVERVDGPERRVLELQVGDLEVGGVHQLDQMPACDRLLPAVAPAVARPPRRPTAVDRPPGVLQPEMKR